MAFYGDADRPGPQQGGERAGGVINRASLRRRRSKGARSARGCPCGLGQKTRIEIITVYPENYRLESAFWGFVDLCKPRETRQDLCKPRETLGEIWNHEAMLRFLVFPLSLRVCEGI